MFKLFIKRPILSGVISVIIVCLGVLSILTLPITQFPDIVPPSVTVTARYTGASADVMSKTVATPLERAINGVPGMTYMTTVCTNDGMSLTTIYFKVGTDPDVAAVNVQNRVTTVLDELPEEVIRAGVITEKEVNSMLMYLNIMSTDSAHTEKFVYNFADINILREFIIRKSKFPQNPKRSVRFSGKRTKRSVQKRKARNTQKAETKVL